MINAEKALECLRSSLESMHLRYEVSNLTDKLVELDVINNSVSIPVWFDTSKQLYGFNLLAGGCKTYADIGEFKSFFLIYIDIYTKFIPTAKAIANVFDTVIGQTTVYENFTGNRKSGYTASFRCLGLSTNGVLIFKDKFYHAKYVKYNEDHSKTRVLKEYFYDYDENGDLVLLPNAESYFDRLCSAYSDSTTVDIERVEDARFNIKIEGMTLDVTVKFAYTSLWYVVNAINGEAVSLGEVRDLPNPYSLEDLYMHCSNWYNDNMVGMPVESDEIAVPEVDIPGSVSESDSLPEEDNEVASEVDDEEGGVDPMNSDFEVVKVVDSNGKATSLQFVLNGNLYNMSVDAAESLGIPVNRICEETELVAKRGILLTSKEKEMRCFAEDISGNRKMCQKVLEALFE